MKGKYELMNLKGEIHFVNTILSEYTLCGDAFDLDSDDLGGSDPNNWGKKTNKKKITCSRCKMIIAEIKQYIKDNIKTKEQPCK